MRILPVFLEYQDQRFLGFTDACAFSLQMLESAFLQTGQF